LVPVAGSPCAPVRIPDAERGRNCRRWVWYFFYYYLSRFCPLARPYIDQERRLDPTIWESFLRLCDQLDGIEAAKRRRIESSLVVSPQDLARFVNEELAL
jgi:hypothetical protein